MSFFTTAFSPVERESMWQPLPSEDTWELSPLFRSVSPPLLTKPQDLREDAEAETEEGCWGPEPAHGR